MDLLTVDKLLTTTRAVRKRLDLGRAVPDEVILECLRLAIQAPTGSNAQLWRWIVVTDPDLRAKLGVLYRDRSGELTATTLPAVADTEQNRRMMDSTRYLTAHIDEVPALVI